MRLNNAIYHLRFAPVFSFPDSFPKVFASSYRDNESKSLLRWLLWEDLCRVAFFIYFFTVKIFCGTFYFPVLWPTYKKANYYSLQSIFYQRRCANQITKQSYSIRVRELAGGWGQGEVEGCWEEVTVRNRNAIFEILLQVIREEGMKMPRPFLYLGPRKHAGRNWKVEAGVCCCIPPLVIDCAACGGECEQGRAGVPFTPDKPVSCRWPGKKTGVGRREGAVDTSPWLGKEIHGRDNWNRTVMAFPPRGSSNKPRQSTRHIK